MSLLRYIVYAMVLIFARADRNSVASVTTRFRLVKVIALMRGAMPIRLMDKEYLRKKAGRRM